MNVNWFLVFQTSFTCRGVTTFHLIRNKPAQLWTGRMVPQLTPWELILISCSVPFDLYSTVLFCFILRSITFSPSDLFFLVLFTASSHSRTVTSLCIHRAGVLIEGLALLQAFTVIFFSPHTHAHTSLIGPFESVRCLNLGVRWPRKLNGASEEVLNSASSAISASEVFLTDVSTLTVEGFSCWRWPDL